MRPLRAFLVLGVIVSSSLVFSAYHPASADASSEVKTRIERMAAARDGDFWVAVGELELMGTEAIPALLEGLKRPEAKVRMGVAKALYRCGEKKEAVAALQNLIAEKDKDVRRLSADILADVTRSDANFGDRKSIEKAILAAMDEADDQHFQIALARALYSVNNNISAIETLTGLLKAKDSTVRRDAALALAEVDDFEIAMPELKKIALEPGEKGALARLYLRHKELQDSLLRRVADKPSRKYALLDEMIEMIKNSYVDGKKADEEALIEGAARGIAETLDPFSVYLNEKEKEELTQGIDRKYGGIGAHVSTRDDFLTIERPVYDGPAYRAGLRSLDRITEIEGKSTFKRPIDECVSRLKGDPGTKVTFKIARRGWSEPRSFTLERARISIRTASGELLPGKIGWIQISSFGGDTNEEMREVIKTLLDQGATSFIFDLRNNPGGLLNEVVAMIDRFVPAGKVVCTTKNKNGDKLEEFTSKDDESLDLPIAVLINEGSASAAEIFSGAIQDFALGAIVGERSYGKGSVQRIEPLKATRGKSAFKMTFAKYYLPSGRSIHIDRDKYGRVPDAATGGVVPDIEVKQPERDLWKEFEFAKILDSGALDTYLAENYDNNKEALTKLASASTADPAAIPGFDKWLATLKTHAEKHEVAQLLRQHVRRRVADDRKKEFLVDLEADAQGQRGILEVLKKAKVDPESVPEYKVFAHAFDEAKK